MNSNWLKYVFLIGFCLIVALPLLSSQPYFSPPDWSKTIVFRIILSLLIFLFLCQFILSKSKNQEILEKLSFLFSKKNIIFWLLVSFLTINLLATIFSPDPNFSFWGNPYRSGGFLNLSFYAIFGILAFLILKEKDWRRILNLAMLIGIMASLIAIFQWQGLFKDVLVTYETRPPSTLGNPIMLALYLLLLTFLTLSLAIRETKPTKKIIYSLVIFLFVFIIFLTYSRAAYLGLATGFLYFIFFFPYKKRVLSLVLKSSLLIILLLGVYGVYYINTKPQLPEFIKENKTLTGITSRLSTEKALRDPRISGWKVSWQALKDRPVLGYGPENFAIGFDRYYDPSLAGINMAPGSSDNWWDRAHNFVFDISLSAGIPALIIYLSLFGALIFKLNKIKETAIQAAFIGYLTANFFSFDAFASYLILFLLIGYSLYLCATYSKSQPLSS